MSNRKIEALVAYIFVGCVWLGIATCLFIVCPFWRARIVIAGVFLAFILVLIGTYVLETKE